MGKYAKKTQVAKAKSTDNTNIKKQQSAKNNKTKRAKKGKAAARVSSRARVSANLKGGRQNKLKIKTPAPKGGADVDMDQSEGAGAEPVEPGQSESARVVRFLNRAKTEAKLTDALKKAMNVTGGMGTEAMGAAVTHLAGRGYVAGVRLLLENGAPNNQEDPKQDLGRRTPIQLAASRGHVNVVRLLCEAGTDRTGALEASHDLAKLGAIYLQEKQAIQAALRR